MVLNQLDEPVDQHGSMPFLAAMLVLSLRLHKMEDHTAGRLPAGAGHAIHSYPLAVCDSIAFSSSWALVARDATAVPSRRVLEGRFVVSILPRRKKPIPNEAQD